MTDETRNPTNATPAADAAAGPAPAANTPAGSPSGGMSRRDMLRKTALAGGAFAVAAPTVQSIMLRDAAADEHVTPFDCCSDPADDDRIQYVDLRYDPQANDAPETACIQVIADGGNRVGDVLFSGVVGQSDEFRVSFEPCTGPAIPDVRILVCSPAEDNGGDDCECDPDEAHSVTEQHTSCSEPLFPGDRWGDVTLQHVECC